MRLSRLDLARYGCFTDQVIDFGAAPPGAPDLHIVYGPNESGKTTALDAYSALLFGVPQRSLYDFLHDYRSMRVGARLEITGAPVELVRVKGRKNDLLGPDDAPIDEGVLGAVLGTIDREAYAMMFSLDDRTLVQGGQAILESKGELGALLFSATSGLAGIHAGLETIREEADGLFRPRRQSTRLRELRQRLDELKARQGEIDVQAARYGEMRGTMEEARTAHEAARAERRELQLRLDAVRRRLDALPRWHKLLELREQHLPLQHLPDPPAGWAERVDLIATEEAVLASRIRSASADVARLEEDVEALEVDDHLLERAEPIDRLTRLEDRFTTAAQDLPRREGARQQERARLAAALQDIGRDAHEDAHALVLPATTIARLNELIGERSGLLAARQSAREEVRLARQATEEAAEALEALTEETDLSDLEALARTLRRADYAGDAETLAAEIAGLDGRIADALAAMAPWAGEIEELAGLTVPEHAALARWRDALAEQRAEEARRSEEVEELEQRLETLGASAEALTAGEGVVGDDEIAAARGVRERRWGVHRQTIEEGGGREDLGSSADAFEAALGENDALIERRAQQSEGVAQLRQIRVEESRGRTALGRARRRLEEAHQARAETRARVDAAVAPLGFGPGVHPEDIDRWLQRRDALMTLRAERRALARRLAENEARGSSERDHLARVLLAAGVAHGAEAGVERLVEIAEQALADARTQRTRREAVETSLRQARSTLASREQAMCEAEDAVTAWDEAWSALLGACWLGEGGAERSPGEVAQILGALGDIRQVLQSLDGLTRQIDGMRRDQDAFTGLLRQAAAETGVAFDEGDALGCANRLRAALEATRAKSEIRRAKRGELARIAGGRRQAETELKALEAERDEMLKRYDAGDLDGLRRALAEAATKQRLRSDIAELEEAMLAGLGLASLAEAESALADAERENLEREKLDLEERLEAEAERLSRLYHELKTAEAALEAVSAGAEVARLAEERQTVLLEMEEVSWRYLRLQVGAEAAEAALGVYRDRHRSSMMLSAADGFRRITGGRFADLRTQPGKDGEVLVGIQAGGGSLLADAMSKGTRDQLFLALRMAGYLEFAKAREPLPFIADDILETFDDERAAATFDLLAEVAAHGQVIYLTHHAHLCEIARRVCGDRLTVHELPGPMAA